MWSINVVKYFVHLCTLRAVAFLHEGNNKAMA